MHYNTYLTKCTYFGCGIIQKSHKQEKILQSIYEEPILRKLGYSIKFPNKVLYMRRNVLEIGLLRLKIIIETLALKLHIGYKRSKKRIAKLINMNEDMQFIESSYNMKVLSQQKK